ncbi:hypothetical protein [Paraburkholderia caledonica]|uniref:Phosphoadenosine phosphosulphate reductase domain-containing protein n=1 Tax=Paraburkholderia caledonica TaxID=134536 RepID=A0AB73IKZ2_9BURK|nr:hypothetical protein [Paraburkholderia caledonica]
MFDEILTKIETAIAVLVELIKAGHPLCGTASGKDSTCAVILMLEAVRRVSAEQGRQPAHYVSTANTTIENVSVARHIETMLEEIDNFAADHMLDVTTHVTAPSLAMQFVVSTIGRGTLVRTPENGVRNGKRTRACATYGDRSNVNGAADTRTDSDAGASRSASHAEPSTILCERPLDALILLTLRVTANAARCI